MLQEVGVPYALRYVDLMMGPQNKPDSLSINPMGKLPTLVDGDLVATEVAAIGLCLADRYAHSKLAPALDAPARAIFLSASRSP